MVQAVVVNSKGQKIARRELGGREFHVSPNAHLVWEAVKAQLASLRSGTHSTLRRSEVRGGGKKPYKQKGTGRARQGSTRSPQFVGGGSVFGPKPRDYAYRLPKKERALALAGVLSSVAQSERFGILQELSVDAFRKTQVAEQFLQELGWGRVLIVVDKRELPLVKAFANVKGVKIVSSGHVGVYDILRHGCTLWTENAYGMIENRLKQALGE